MAVVSNQYSTRVFSEHPTALWPLDDEAYFISLINDNDRDITLWNLTNCNASSFSSILDEPSPFEDENYYSIIGDQSGISGFETILTAQSNALFSFNSLSQDLKNICINFYLYQDSVFANYYQFGFRYFNDLTSSYEEILTTVDAAPFSRWIRLNDTFDISEFDSDSCELIIKISVTEGGGEDEDYTFIINGLSVGQWSEQSSAKSLGSIPQLIPEEIGLPSQYGIPAKQYGFLNNDGYYLVEDGILLAKNEGVPLVFGAENSTKIIASQNESPSLVLPSQNMFSDKGKYKQYTLEFWMRINPNTTKSLRIFGPLNSTDGLYVSEGFLTLVLGQHISTHYINKWYRPMLIHITYSVGNISLLINGEKVIDLLINEIPNSFELNSDWIGFYSYEDIDVFEIDSVSVMSYVIPIPVAKRRFVWGQGVESQQTIDSSFKGESISPSFTNANYAANIIYPDKEGWGSGFYHNFEPRNLSLALPAYSLPIIYSGNRSIDLWNNANKIVNEIEDETLSNPFITFRPGLNENSTEWDRISPDWDEQFYLFFSSSNVLSTQMSSIYGIFEIMESVEEERPLIHFVNNLTKKRFEINIFENEVTYVFGGVEIHSETINIGEPFAAGIYIPGISQNFGYSLSSFFSSYELLEIYVGGAKNIPLQQFNTFEGKIYKVSFADEFDYQNISSYFTSTGVIESSESNNLLDHYSTYTVSAFIDYDRFFLDISIDSYWEEYFPLSFFAKNIVSGSNTYYGLDYLQFNVDYPSIINYTINGNLPENVELDLDESPMKMFATFQLISEGANQNLSDFSYEKKLTFDKIVDASLENTSLQPYKSFLTKFNIVDGCTIYPPKNVKFEDSAIVIHFVLNQKRILSKPLSIRSMSISSRALDIFEPNKIGTKFSKNIYPYVKNGIYFNYKEKNPVYVGTDVNPYLYLSNESGIKVFSYSEENKEYAISIPINETKSAQFSLAAFQLFFKYEMLNEIKEPISIFEIQNDKNTIEFVLEKDSSQKRNIIFARDKTTKAIYENIVFYQNGINVNKPFILKNEWNCIGILFPSPITFNDFVGSINIFSGCLFNNISFYAPEGLNIVSAVDVRSWQKVLTEDNINNLDWQYWYNENGLSPTKNWRQVYVLSEEDDYVISPSDIFSTYSGTNIDFVDDNEGINVFNDEFNVYTEIIWSSTVGKPA